jgi:transposase InsO family protein
MMGKEASVSELSLAFGVSRKTAYKWRSRFIAGGKGAMNDQSRARQSQPHAVSDTVRRVIIEARRSHPTWGAKKLLPWLSGREPELALPSLSTVGQILADAKLTEPKGPPRRKPTAAIARISEPTQPNQLWAVDFKGQFRMGDGSLCYPLTVTDRFSRYLFLVRALSGTGGDPVKRAFEDLFIEHGLPDRIRSDNGTPFAGTGLSRLSLLAVWWMSLDILPDLIDPGCPYQNGRHERMHRVLKEETTRPPGHDLVEQQTKFDVFDQEYNTQRPHEALNFACPAQVHCRSQRDYKPASKIDDDVFAGHFERRVVQKTGCIKWKGAMVFVSETLAGRLIGLHETLEDVWVVQYRHYPVGLLNQREGSPRIQDIRKAKKKRNDKLCAGATSNETMTSSTAARGSAPDPGI